MHTAQAAFSRSSAKADAAVNLARKLKVDPELALRWMNEAGVLGRFVPDFGRIVAQMQFDMYHHYTVDEHTIRAELEGNLCRCTGYHNIVKAIAAAAEVMHGKRSELARAAELEAMLAEELALDQQGFERQRVVAAQRRGVQRRATVGQHAVSQADQLRGGSAHVGLGLGQGLPLGLIAHVARLAEKDEPARAVADAN